MAEVINNNIDNIENESLELYSDDSSSSSSEEPTDDELGPDENLSTTPIPERYYDLYDGDVNNIVSWSYNKKEKCWEINLLEPYAVQITLKKNGYNNTTFKLGYDSDDINIFMNATSTSTSSTPEPTDDYSSSSSEEPTDDFSSSSDENPSGDATPKTTENETEN